MPSSSKHQFQTFTVGKLDAGMILIGDKAHLIEFPSLLLPPGTVSGSMVSISVHRNHAAERQHSSSFSELQASILETYGTRSPAAPVLSLRNTTQTSVTLEWAKLDLANAKLRGVEIYRNGTRLAGIPNPSVNTSTKLSSLALDTDYTFQLVMKTSAGTYPSNVVRVRTHTINDTSGINVCFGNVQDAHLLHQAKSALEQMGAKYSEKIQIDTTHFVCTTPAGTGSASSGPGVEYQKALQLTLPVVEPHWILACQHDKKMVPISQHLLGTNPTTFSTASFTRAPSAPPSPQMQASFPPRREPSPESRARMDSAEPVAVLAASSSSSAAQQEDEQVPEPEPEPPRPRTPGGGQLNRGFKFPLASDTPPTTPPADRPSTPSLPLSPTLQEEPTSPGPQQSIRVTPPSPEVETVPLPLHPARPVPSPPDIRIEVPSTEVSGIEIDRSDAVDEDEDEGAKGKGQSAEQVVPEPEQVEAQAEEAPEVEKQDLEDVKAEESVESQEATKSKAATSTEDKAKDDAGDVGDEMKDVDLA